MFLIHMKKKKRIKNLLRKTLLTIKNNIQEKEKKTV